MKRLRYGTVCLICSICLVGCSQPEGGVASETSPPDSSPSVTTDDDEAIANTRQDAATAPRRGVASDPASDGGRLQPADLQYMGAFRLPGGSGGSNWEYSAYAMTYYPDGDAKAPDDGFPGSIFAIGHDHHQKVSEISIPAPVVSKSKQITDLPVASTLQPFVDVRGGLLGELEIPRAGLEYLPSLTANEPGKLHLCWGQHFQFEQSPSHGWCELTLAAPNTRGLWKLADLPNYLTNDYLFEIPQSWADRHLPGYRLATGRFRDGQWGGLGPALLAYAPPDETSPPAKGAVIAKIKPLLMYGRPQANSAELEINANWKMDGFAEADEWSGGAWLTLGNRRAVVLVGTKGIGKTWYGFANGVVYPISGDANDPVPDVPPFPFDARGWWSQNVAAQIVFFDTDELAAVAKGRRESWTPQPYATLAIDDYLYDAGYDHPRQKRYALGACCFDRARGILYVAERQVRQDEDRSLIHAFRLVR